jgi:hypothetical protein
MKALFNRGAVNSGLTIGFLITVLVIILIYLWNDNNSLQNRINNQSLQIDELQKGVTDIVTKVVASPKPVGPETYSGLVAQSGGLWSGSVRKLAWIGAGFANVNSEYLYPADNYLIHSFSKEQSWQNFSVSCKDGYGIISAHSQTGNKLIISATKVITVIEDQPTNNIIVTCEKQ